MSGHYLAPNAPNEWLAGAVQTYSHWQNISSRYGSKLTSLGLTVPGNNTLFSARSFLSLHVDIVWCPSDSVNRKYLR